MITPFLRWLSVKKYQFEVTLPFYMMSPTECFILYSILFLLFSLILIAAVLYLPEHVAIMASRATFYWGGEGTPGARGGWKWADLSAGSSPAAGAGGSGGGFGGVKGEL